MGRGIKDGVAEIFSGMLAIQGELAATRAHRGEPRDRVHFPTFTGAQWSEAEVVDAGDALTATLDSVNAAARRLARQGVTLDLGGEPLTMQLAGELVGISPDSGRVAMVMRSRGKDTSNGK